MLSPPSSCRQRDVSLPVMCCWAETKKARRLIVASPYDARLRWFQRGHPRSRGPSSRPLTAQQEKVCHLIRIVSRRKTIPEDQPKELLTALIRQYRFVEGLLEHAAKSGLVLRIVPRGGSPGNNSADVDQHSRRIQFTALSWDVRQGRDRRGGPEHLLNICSAH